MAKTNGAKTAQSAIEQPMQEAVEVVEVDVAEVNAEDVSANSSEPTSSSEDIDDCLGALKTLLSTVEKLQKVRQEVGDIKPLLVRMLDGEVLSGDELEQLKTGVGGLFRLVKAYSDHQTALANAQPARKLLDQVLKPTGKVS